MTDIAVRIAKLIMNRSNKSIMSKEKVVECQRNIDKRVRFTVHSACAPEHCLKPEASARLPSASVSPAHCN